MGSPRPTHLGPVGHVSVSSESPGWASAYSKISLETALRPMWSGQACLARMLGSRPNTSSGQERGGLAHSFPDGQHEPDSKQGWLPRSQCPAASRKKHGTPGEGLSHHHHRQVVQGPRAQRQPTIPRSWLIRQGEMGAGQPSRDARWPCK